MQTLIGLYIEDEPKNITLMQGRFSLYKGIELIGLESFPQTFEGLYDEIIDKKIDFLIVDHELDKVAVSYKGIDVLREIRKHDSNIYAVLLTNYPLDDYKDELGEYDFQLNKADLADSGRMKELVDKIRRACTLRADNSILSLMDSKQKALEQLLKEIRNTTEDN